MKFWKYILTVIMTAGTFGLPVALATDAPVSLATTSTTENITQLIQIKDDASISGADKEEKELEARLTIIKDVLKLSTDEIIKLQDKLHKLPQFADESRENVLKTEYQASLDDFSTYYADESKKLDDVKTNDDAKALAEELKEYRDATYNPEIKNIANFTILFYTADVVKLGKARLNKISGDISKLEKLGYFKTGTFTSKLKKARTLLDEADGLQQEAAEIILAPLTPPAPETTETDAIQKDPTTQQTGDGTDTTTQVVEEPKDPGDLNSESLQDVKDTYDIFLQIGKDLKKYLGLK